MAYCSRLAQLILAAWLAAGFHGSILVSHHGRIVMRRGDPHKTYNIGSNTKTFTAAAALLLVQDGRLTLSDSVRRLLTHTTGGQYEYRNENYEALARIIADSSGMSYAKFLQQRIFVPLGLHDTKVSKSDGATGIESSASDLLKWARLPHGNAMKPQAFARMEGARRVSYGFGWGVEEENGRIVEVRHYGWDGNYSSAIRIFPLYDLVIVVCSGDGAIDNRSWSALRAHQLGDSLLQKFRPSAK